MDDNKSGDNKSKDPTSKKALITLDVDAGTLVLVLGILILAPLLLTGFFAQ